MRRELVVLGCVVSACSGSNHSPTHDSAVDVSPDADEVAIGTDVSVDSGPVHGATAGDLVVFKGIPYATAGRWQVPVAPVPWTTPKDASAFGPACPQPGHPTLAQSEDCLTLNVWAHASGPHRPVMVYIHGGGYTEGTASEIPYDGAQLADAADAIVVSFDYRVGILGFLALPQLAAADGGVGNWGIRDQIAALGWVQRNIASFGGDPTRVMIIGESAGGASVCTLLGAPSAQGLFASAAIESGPCRLALAPTTPTGTFPAAEGYGAYVAGQLGCTSGDIAACLRSKSSDQILALTLPSFFDLGIPVHPTLPVVDGVVLDMRPLAALRAGRGAVPAIAGSNHDDASFFIYAMGVADTSGSFDSYVTAIGQNANRSAIEALYPVAMFGERGAAIAYATDVAFACVPMQVASARTAPTYVYELERAVPNGPLVMYQSVHGYDFVNLFGTFTTWGITPAAADLAVSADMQAQWSALAHDIAPAGWTASSSAMPSFRQLDSAPSTGTTWRGDRCAQLVSLGIVTE